MARDDELILDSKLYQLGDTISWHDPVFGSELVLFERVLMRVRSIEAQMTTKLRGRTVETGNRYNDYHGYGTSIMEALEEGLKSIRGFPEMEMKVHAYVRTDYAMMGEHGKQRVPTRWFDASDREKVTTWHYADRARGDNPEPPKFYDWDNFAKRVVWDSKKDFERSRRALSAVLDELTLRPDGSRLDIPAVREKVLRLGLATVEQAG